ncbi:unnamed protein product (macronuclear) [Paramecium tetraurelia]|uniref:C3H1-type domain-containing protein n=3 Tax=Paramecium TaxID=5884 RepID=A0E664_PARTE|nr:uncharacterized protein GSPATT00003646001 [Paramecium tetraurelia]CAK90781.1 unnamed protein product [Paramecium tetraurelia]|eukprot:XP_001458178.1 hypothetical protein (macronuclear) [Paramecium tetraurelia strain d4-2]
MSYQFGGSQLQQQNVPNAKYKTMLCRHYQGNTYNQFKQLNNVPLETNVNLLMELKNKDKSMVFTNILSFSDPLPASALSAMATVIEQPLNKPQPPIFQSIAQIIIIFVPCKYHAQNYCKNGQNCQYIHDSEANQQQSIPFQPQPQMPQMPSPPPQVKQEDPMQLVFQHISFEMQYIFPQDDIIQKLKIAQEQARVGNLIAVAECIKSIIHAPERTQEEILKYTNLYNQAVTYFNQISQAN